MGLKDVKNIDYTKKENQTFNNWFWFCMSNLWLPLFVVFFTLLTLQIIYFGTVLDWVLEAYAESTGTGIFVSFFMFLPILGSFLLARKGLWKHWKYVCSKDNKYAE